MGKSPFVLLLLYTFTYVDLNLCQPTSAQNNDPGNGDVANDAQTENADNDAQVPSNDTRNQNEPLPEGSKNATDGPRISLSPFNLESAYNEWHRNKEKRKQEEMADHEKTVEIISHGAKALYDRIKTIIANMSITRRQECELVRHVILAATRDARDEFARSISMKLVTFCFRSSPPNSIGARFLEMNKEAFRHPPSHFDQDGHPNDRGRPTGHGYGNKPSKNLYPKSKWHPPTYMHPDAMHPYMDPSYVHPAYMHPAYVNPAYVHPAMQTPYVHPSYAYGVPPPVHNPYDHHFIKYLKVTTNMQWEISKTRPKGHKKNGKGNQKAAKNVQAGSSSSSSSSSEAKDVKGQGKNQKKGSKPKGVKNENNGEESSSESDEEPSANANNTQPKKEKTPTEDVNKPSHKPLNAAPKSIKFKDLKAAPLAPQKKAKGNAHKAVSAEEAQQTPMTPQDTQDPVQPTDPNGYPSPNQAPDVNDSPAPSQDPTQNTENTETNAENAANTENTENDETEKDKKGKEDNADAELSKTDDKESSSEDVDDESEDSSEDSDEKKGEKSDGKGKADAGKPAGENGAKKQK
ncbi:hypothetical protein DdX_17598 [Ditylenchus destructor]|uniref:Uncharacterized protein n=1 Tax=Ditylenchus destructor TaxID=166010 RepID=A0AAD4MMR8_9BILA|nr:hypothetical protein DdX_17598 [Ditylenchus destructor]